MRLVKRLPAIICIVYVFLASLYSVLIPLYEPQDENYHFAFAQWVRQTGQLPVQDPSVKQPWKQEGSQAPLYYVLAALIVRIVPGAEQPYVLNGNPHAVVGIRDSPANHNIFTHTAAEVFPWRGPVLAIHLIRLMGVVFGALTVWFIYLSARLAVPEVPAISPLAMAFAAFNPMFLMQMACVNNDSLVTVLGAAATWLILLIWRRGFTWKLVWILAIVVALTGLSKASGLTVGVVAAAMLAIMALKRCISFKQMALALLVLGGVFAVLSGWWYVRNIQLYGDLTGLRTLSRIVGLRAEPSTVSALLRDSDLLRVSFWGFYGWENIFIGPDWLPAAADILIWLIVLGAVWSLIRVIRLKRFDLLIPTGLLGLHFLIMVILVINYTWQIPASVGRLLLPAMAAISILAVYGWYSAACMVRLPRLTAAPVAGLALVAMLSPFLSLRPAYAMPPVVSALPADASPLDVQFGTIDVLGYSISRQPVFPGGVLPITIYYRGEPDPRNLSLYLTVLGQNDQPIGKIDSYPGGGMLPTSMWNPGSIYGDTYYVPIAARAEGPVQFQVEFGWWDFATGERIKPTRADGTPLDTLILRGGTLLSTEAAARPSNSQQAVFAGALRIDGYTFTPADGVVQQGEPLAVSLIWEGLAPVNEDYTVFVHLQTQDGKLVAQADSPPLDGAYPTSSWAPTHPFADRHRLVIDPATVPPGTYSIVIGLYRLSDGSRLSTGSGGDSVTLQMPVTVR